MAEGRYMLSGTMTPVDINSEDFKKKADELWTKIKKQGHIIVTNSEKYKNITPEELKEMFKDGRTVSIDIDFSK